MNEKKERILMVAIRLFSQKGYYETSIQEIADHSGISKGAFYLHFSSKEELVLSILKSYYNLVREKMMLIEDEQGVSPREKLAAQISVYFQEIVQRKELIMMQLREQALPMNEEVQDFMVRIRIEIQQWYEKIIEEIYGKESHLYKTDGAILLDGLINAYIRLLLISSDPVDFTKLSAFIVRRLDDLMEGLLRGEEEPMAITLIKEEVFPSPSLFHQQLRKEVKSLLIRMDDLLDTLPFAVEKKEDAMATVKYLLNELEKEQPQKVIFQGLLANLREIKELDEYRQQLAERLNIKLL